MSKALQTIHTLARAESDMRVCLALTVFVRGGMAQHVEAVRDIGDRLALCGRFESVGLPPVRGMERMSYCRCLFNADMDAARIGSLAGWIFERLPAWWASAGFIFDYDRGDRRTAHASMGALAKRFWCVQIQDLTSLQWLAVDGMPGVNWLTLVGKEFVESRGMDVDNIYEQARLLFDQGIFSRRLSRGVALAAGSTPVTGDLNVLEDVSAYVRIAQLLRPLLLTTHMPLAGPFAKNEIMSTWLARWSDPQRWLDCDLSTDS